MVPAALNAVLYAFQPKAATDDLDYQVLCSSLFQQAGSPVFLDAVFDAVGFIIDMVRPRPTQLSPVCVEGCVCFMLLR